MTNSVISSFSNTAYTFLCGFHVKISIMEDLEKMVQAASLTFKCYYYTMVLSQDEATEATINQCDPVYSTQHRRN